LTLAAGLVIFGHFATCAVTHAEMAAAMRGGASAEHSPEVVEARGAGPIAVATLLIALIGALRVARRRTGFALTRRVLPRWRKEETSQRRPRRRA